MSYNGKGFNKEQLEQIAQVVVATVQPLLQPIIDRLDVIESLPTIKKELKSLQEKE